MNIIKQRHDIMRITPEPLKLIEMAGRTCYKSEDKITDGSAAEFVRRMVKSGHHSVIEHASATVRFITDRGVLAELTRHRLAAYSVESTRYCNYSGDKFNNEITVILPVEFYEMNNPGNGHLRQQFDQWNLAMEWAETSYFNLLRSGSSPQLARSVLPNSLKTEIVMTANMREWRHVFAMRCQKAAHPQIRSLMNPLLADFAKIMPPLFEDLAEMYL